MAGVYGCLLKDEGIRPNKQAPRRVASVHPVGFFLLSGLGPAAQDICLCLPLRWSSYHRPGSFLWPDRQWLRISTGSGRARGEKRNSRYLDKSPEKRQNLLSTGKAQRHVSCHPQLPSLSCHQFWADLSGLISLGEVVMCLSNYSFKWKHHLHHRLLRRAFPGLWEQMGPEPCCCLQEA